eukprot:490058-Rhodomonas_salina.1
MVRSAFYAKEAADLFGEMTEDTKIAGDTTRCSIRLLEIPCFEVTEDTKVRRPCRSTSAASTESGVA